jgi:flagellar protein FliL
MAAKDKQAEAEEDAGEEQAPAEGGRRWLSKKLILMVVGGLFAVGAIGGGAYFFLSGGKKEEKVAAAPAKPPAFVDLPDVLVNLSIPPGERTQYLKVKIVLELADAALVPQVQPLLPRVIDTFQVFLRELRPSDLEGSAGMFRLKEELTRRVNAAIAPTRVNAVLFKEMIVQ